MVVYGPRISTGASGLGSHVSIWLGPPESQKRMTAFLLAGEVALRVPEGSRRMLVPRTRQDRSGETTVGFRHESNLSPLGSNAPGIACHTCDTK